MVLLSPNFPHYRLIIRGWFHQLFGAETIEKLSADQRKFLGIEVLENLEPEEDIEIVN
jgi:hypothetical protein